MNDLPYYLHCYRNDDEKYPLVVGQDYHPSGQVGLTSQHFENPYTGKEYEANPEGELGFRIKTQNKWIYFSEETNSDIFYGKWFFDNEEYTQYKREYKIKNLLENE